MISNSHKLASNADTLSSLGQALADARRACKLTQQDLCNKTGIAYSTLTKIERGAIRKPNIFTVLKIAQATDLQIEDLMQFNPSLPLKPVIQSETTDKKIAKSGIKFVFFDIHQTLINSTSNMLPLISRQYNIPLMALENMFLKYNESLCRGQLALEDFDIIICRTFNIDSLNWQELYLQLATPDENVIQACLWAMKYYRVGILTNAFSGNCHNLIKRNIIPHDFEIIVDSSQIGLIKPEKAIYDYAQAQTNLKASEILLIDDRKINILMAEKYGWRGLQINTNNTSQTFNNMQKILEF